MATFKKTLKYLMLEYPTLYHNPVDVCIELFACIGSCYEWKNGEIVDACTKNIDYDIPKAMNYPDEKRYNEFDQTLMALVRLYDGFHLRNEAELLRMKFTADNINRIIEAPLTMIYFGRERSQYYFTKGLVLDYANAFKFPKNIKEDWAKALYEFLNHWLVHLNQEYGVHPTNLDDISFWPKDIQEARAKIIETRNRLHPHAHDGITYEQHLEHINATMKRLKDNI